MLNMLNMFMPLCLRIAPSLLGSVSSRCLSAKFMTAVSKLSYSQNFPKITKT